MAHRIEYGYIVYVYNSIHTSISPSPHLPIYPNYIISIQADLISQGTGNREQQKKLHKKTDKITLHPNFSQINVNYSYVYFSLSDFEYKVPTHSPTLPQCENVAKFLINLTNTNSLKKCHK
ncbi:MAG: hypothetical protein F6K39_37625 [Okeania sp. SIO3B3]|nr:hypothetical protein [Okeania sp. SIO3B3]